jgi:hypothetical protein
VSTTKRMLHYAVVKWTPESYQEAEVHLQVAGVFNSREVMCMAPSLMHKQKNCCTLRSHLEAEVHLQVAGVIILNKLNGLIPGDAS